MNLKEGTRTVFLAVGNESHTKNKLLSIDMLKEAEVWIIYSDRISADCKTYIKQLAKKYSFVTLDNVKKSKRNKISGRLIRRIKEINSYDPDIHIVLLSSAYRSGKC